MQSLLQNINPMLSECFTIGNYDIHFREQF